MTFLFYFSKKVEPWLRIPFYIWERVPVLEQTQSCQSIRNKARTAPHIDLLICSHFANQRVNLLQTFLACQKIEIFTHESWKGYIVRRLAFSEKRDSLAKCRFRQWLTQYLYVKYYELGKTDDALIRYYLRWKRGLSCSYHIYRNKPIFSCFKCSVRIFFFRKNRDLWKFDKCKFFRLNQAIKHMHMSCTFSFTRKISWHMRLSFNLTVNLHAPEGLSLIKIVRNSKAGLFQHTLKHGTHRKHHPGLWMVFLYFCLWLKCTLVL